MENPYLTFQKFNDAGLAEVVAGKLKELHIESQLENERPNFDPSYAFNHVEPTIHLKIQANDFPKAQSVLEEYYEGQLQDVDPDYYLLAFSNRELQEIIEKPDEWGHFDYALAKKLLAERGFAITPAKAGQLKEERLHELAKPETTGIYWIFAGYLLAILGGILGLLLGYIIAYLKKTLPNGERVYVYLAAERVHGKRILILSVISIPAWYIWRFWVIQR